MRVPFTPSLSQTCPSPVPPANALATWLLLVLLSRPTGAGVA
jgi:hypothetical protein